MQNSTPRSFSAASQLGRVLGGRFRIDACLGTGSMGVVYKSWDTQAGRHCAVKLFLPELAHRPTDRVRFLDEATIASQLCHENIVKVWNHAQAPDGTLYLVMEFLSGRDLSLLLKEQGSLPLLQTLHIIKQVGSALQLVHLAGIVHRDIKPKNIFVLDGNEADLHFTVKLIDFGLARLLDPRKAPRRGSEGMLIGTPDYLPPEAWHGISAHVDACSDQWALAVLTYQLLSGQLPYKLTDTSLHLGSRAYDAPPTPLGKLVRDLPPHIESAVTRALSKEKAQRFPSVLDFVRAMDDLPPPLSIGPAITSASHSPPDCAPSAIPTELPRSYDVTTRTPSLSALIAEARAPRASAAALKVPAPASPGPRNSPTGQIVEPARPVPGSASHAGIHCIFAWRRAAGQRLQNLWSWRPRFLARNLSTALSVAAALLAWSSLLFGRSQMYLPATSRLQSHGPAASAAASFSPAQTGALRATLTPGSGRR